MAEQEIFEAAGVTFEFSEESRVEFHAGRARAALVARKVPFDASKHAAFVERGEGTFSRCFASAGSRLLFRRPKER